MRGPPAVAVALLALAACPAAPAAVAPPPAPRPDGRPATSRQVLLDGLPTAVRWTDGDTFRAEAGAFAGRSFRLQGVNALESYGPVHRWGGWRPPELLQLARRAGRLVRSRTWNCRVLPGGGGYGRELASCPEAARALVEAGLAMVLAVGEAPDPALVAAQREAQARGAGMWRKGVPPRIPTSLHSAGEPDLAGEPYDRLADTRTGHSEVRRHARTYAPCEEVCTGSGAEVACMIYVPFQRRYRDRPACLLER